MGQATAGLIGAALGATTVFVSSCYNLAVVASMDEKTHSRLATQWHELQKVEDKIADALVSYKQSPKESLDALIECHSRIMGVYKSMPMALADILRLGNAPGGAD